MLDITRKQLDQALKHIWRFDPRDFKHRRTAQILKGLTDMQRDQIKRYLRS